MQSLPLLKRLALCCVLLGLTTSHVTAEPDLAQITCLIPAPLLQPGLASFAIAQGRHLYEKASLKVNFLVAQGGMAVATQVGAGIADLGVALGETPIIVRPRGILIRNIAILGEGSAAQLVVRDDSGIREAADLKGKTVTVMSYQDTTYFALLGLMAGAKLSRDDVHVDAAGPSGMWQLVAAGKAQAMVGVPDFGVLVEKTGVQTRWFTVGQFFPTMAPSIVASDAAIAARPRLLRAFVRATLQVTQEIIDQPEQAVQDYIEAVPQQKGNEAEILRIFKEDAARVFSHQGRLGLTDEKRMSAVADFYLNQNIIQTASTVADLFTNDFVP